MENKYSVTSEFDKSLLEELNNKFWENMMWGFPPDVRTEEEKYFDSLKWAYVFINEEDKYPIMVWVSNVDGKAYERDVYIVKKPLEEIKYFKFERWCRPIDM